MKIGLEVCGLDASGSGYVQGPGSCENCKGASGSIKGGMTS